ncbi:MAG: hypothetical protein WCL37_05185, partial [Chrysiogenales bacterium]
MDSFNKPAIFLLPLADGSMWEVGGSNPMGRILAFRLAAAMTLQPLTSRRRALLMKAVKTRRRTLIIRGSSRQIRWTQL